MIGCSDPMPPLTISANGPRAASGTLSINLENRITRQLVCAKFLNGHPELLDPIDDQPYFESTPAFSEEL
jgi:hypothetical protein